MSGSPRLGKTDAHALAKSLLAIHRWRLSGIKPRFSKRSKKAQKRLEREAWEQLDAVIEMGKQLKPTFVDGRAQLLSGKRCPRCLQVQTRIRMHRAYEGPTGTVVIYSCMECKKIIKMEIEEKQNAGTDAQLRKDPAADAVRERKSLAHSTNGRME